MRGLPELRVGQVRFRRRVVIATVLFLAAVGVATWMLVSRGHQRLIEFQAVNLAEVVARQVASARSVYTEHVVGKLVRDGTGRASELYHAEPGNIPLPAQFLKLVGERASDDADGLYRTRPLSKWNLAESQGLVDDFHRWGWAQLEAQDQAQPQGPIAWQAVWRIEHVAGASTLRYMRADPAVSASCVSCHNALETRPQTLALRQRDGVSEGKVFRLHQLMGAIEVDIPLSQVEAMAKGQSQLAFAVVVGLVFAGLAGIGFFVFADMSRASLLTRELAWRASHDELTGLANRGQFERKLAALLEDARTTQASHALMFLDLDQFKLVNDTCGHMAGDELLRQLGAVLKSGLRGADIIARLGGDEFGVLLVGCPPAAAHEVAEKLRRSVHEFRFAWQKRVFEIGVSIGVVSIAGRGESVAELMSAADVACYVAKEGGRNRVHVLAPSDSELLRRRGDMEWATRISRALEDGRMYLAVQEAVALDPALPVRRYQEVLLRMEDEQGRAVPTGTLISAAERYNLMQRKIDPWVVKTVCQLIATGELTANEQNLVAVNLSGASLGDPEFLELVERTLREARVDPRWLCFEVTETAAISNLSSAVSFMQRLGALGCRFALDDFGSGLSSFAYLKNLPVDYLKIDGEFVRDIETDPVDRAMVGSIAQIGRVMGIPTVAEWVENDAALAEVRKLGIDYAQGYGISRPRRVSRS